MPLTPEQKVRLAELEKDIIVTWHIGSKNIRDIAIEHIIAHASKSQIRLIKNNMHDHKSQNI